MTVIAREFSNDGRQIRFTDIPVPPCESFNCRWAEHCKAHQLACRGFAYYIFDTFPHRQRPSTPERKYFDQVFVTHDRELFTH